MLMDRFGRSHTAVSKAAIAAFEDATFAIAAHRPIGDTLARAQSFEPDLPGAFALRAVGGAMLGRAEAVSAAKTEAQAAKEALHRSGGGTAAEQALVKAAQEASNGCLQAAAATLEDHLSVEPHDFLAAKLAHSLRFMSGQQEHMLATTTRLLPHWSDKNPGYGFLLGCHAFGLEEVGRYTEAESAGRQAVNLEAADAWGRHAVSHVMEMSGRSEEGVNWLESSRPYWPECNNFRFHLGWHLALFHLEQGNDSAVLEIYDRDVMPAASDDFRDMANAVSLLWRLRQLGIPVGSRWEQLRDIALKRQTDVTYVFASLHYLLALVANKEYVAAAGLLDELGQASRKALGDQANVAREVGAKLAEIIRSNAGGTAELGAKLTDVAGLLPQLGGSNAQRDLFMRILLIAAFDAEDGQTLQAIARLRSQLRHQDGFARRLTAARTIDAFSGTATRGAA